ncbi:MAG: hypothetical protein ACKVPY_14850 [Paracoccaceae bacterium]
MRKLLAVLALIAGPAFADGDWVTLGQAEAEAALTSRALAYDDGSTQDFRPGGGTTYTSGGSPSQGNWAIRDGRYCSVWPPSDRWDCYDLAARADGTQIRFTDDGGGTTVGRYMDGQ